jgi:NDP-sugar pyrophosphorylase family protein
MTVAWILAAGLGTRLAPLTHERPKPLVEVCGRPLVVHTLQLLANAGGTVAQVKVRFTHEPVALGTGGGLLGLRARLPAGADGQALIANADALIDLDVAAFMAARRPGSLASLALKSVADVARYGAIGTDDDDRVVTFAGRVEPLGVVALERMFCGWHHLDAAALDVLPPVDVENGEPPVVTGPESCINKEGYPSHLRGGQDIRGVDVDALGGGLFVDVGTPARLFEANRLLLSGELSLSALAPLARFQALPGRVFVHPEAYVHVDAVLNGPCVVDKGAVVEAGAVIGPWTVLGPRVHVRRGVRLKRSIVQGARGDAAHVVESDAEAMHIGETCRVGISA